MILYTYVVRTGPGAYHHYGYHWSRSSAWDALPDVIKLDDGTFYLQTLKEYKVNFFKWLRRKI